MNIGPTFFSGGSGTTVLLMNMIGTLGSHVFVDESATPGTVDTIADATAVPSVIENSGNPASQLMRNPVSNISDRRLVRKNLTTLWANANPFGSKAWCVQTWCAIEAYQTNPGYSETLFMGGSAGMWLGVITTAGPTHRFMLSVGNIPSAPTFSVTSSFVLDAGQLLIWHHLAATRNGDVITLYLDGVSQGSAALSAGYVVTPATAWSVGGNYASPGAGYNFTGFMNGLRVKQGTPFFFGNFTPPTRAVVLS